MVDAAVTVMRVVYAYVSMPRECENGGNVCVWDGGGGFAMSGTYEYVGGIRG